ncbi:MAG: C45 family peptidase [Candidatus Marinimicrobia bacterium]|nr:C45 family peptidase [Candidatus Neomarinimicrobiota bacterium]
MKKIFVFTIALFSIAFACTSAIISGSATVDGRPILWKNRDTGTVENKFVFISDKGYDFMGVANAKDIDSKEIWMGMNEKGFAIMNTASYNINEGVTCDVESDQEGLFMRLALETCSNMADFEDLISISSGKWGVEANFGVIDAEGNAAYYETGYYDYTKFDVNDPDVAPGGYIVRTNFSVTGKGDKGQGYIRYDASNKLFKDQDKFSIEVILNKASRNMDHGALRTDIGNMKLPKDFEDETLVAFQDYIVRYWSASVLIVQGVLPGEDPKNTMLWPVMGFPLTAMVTPVFFSSGNNLPNVIITDTNEAPYLVNAALKLKDELFPVSHDDKENYMDVAKLKNRKDNGYFQEIMKAEKIIIEKAKIIRSSQSKEAILDYYKWLDNYVVDVYDKLLPCEPIRTNLPRCDDEKICK